MADNAFLTQGGAWNPNFYANEVLIALEQELGFASRIHRGFDEERRTYNKGELVKIQKPAVFSAANAPATAVEPGVGEVQISMDFHKEVKFKVTDKDLALSSDQLITKHVRPIVYALVKEIHDSLNDLYWAVPWYYDVSATPAVSDINGPRRVLRGNNVPLVASEMSYQLSPTLEEGFLNLSAFSQQQGAGDRGIATQTTGELGQKYGFTFFPDQGVSSHTKGTASTAGYTLGAGLTVGATSMTMVAGAATGTLVKGDTFVIAGHAQRYSVAATLTLPGSGNTTVTFSPPAATTYSNGAAVTFSLDNHEANLVFHRNAFALVFARLPEMNNLGMLVKSIQDPKSGISVRSRLYAVPNSSEVHMAVDALWGCGVLDGNLAVRARN